MLTSNDGLMRSTLLMQKMTSNAPTVNLYEQWGIVCTKIPMPKIEAKELPVHDFAGSDGEDAYIPSTIPVKAYDLTIEFEYKGELDTCYTNIYEGFIKYLLGDTIADDNYDTITEGGFKMYDRHNKMGRQKVYLKNFDPEDLVHFSGDHLIFKLTFRVTDPLTGITLTDPNAKVTL